VGHIGAVAGGAKHVVEMILLSDFVP